MTETPADASVEQPEQAEPLIDQADQTQQDQPAIEAESDSSVQQSIGDEPTPAGDQAASTHDDSDDLQRILQIRVPIIILLAEKTMQTSEILQLNPGTLIEFDKSVDEKLDLMINNKRVGGGVAVKVGENFGLRVTHICPIDKTIKAMGR